MLREVLLLRAGQCRIDQSQLLTGEPVGQMVTIPIWMYLLRSEDAIMLVDTGMPLGCVDNERYFGEGEDGDLIQPKMRADDAVDRVLARQGLSVSDIDALISTHWHFDHAGGNRLFRSQPILVHPAEVEAARSGGYPAECSDMSLNYRLVVDGEEPMPGVTLLHTPGHTPGHMSLLLRPQGAGELLLTIDASYTSRNWELLRPGAMVDPEVGQKSVLRLKEIVRETGAAVFFGHDAGQADTPFWRGLAR